LINEKIGQFWHGSGFGLSHDPGKDLVGVLLGNCEEFHELLGLGLGAGVLGFGGAGFGGGCSGGVGEDPLRLLFDGFALLLDVLADLLLGHLGFLDFRFHGVKSVFELLFAFLHLFLHLLDLFGMGFVVLIGDDGEHRSGSLFGALDLEEGMWVGLGGLTSRTEVEVLEDGALVEVTDDGTDSTAVAGVSVVDGKFGFLGLLDAFHLGKIVGNVGLFGVEDLGDLESDLGHRLGDGPVNLLLDFGFNFLLEPLLLLGPGTAFSFGLPLVFLRLPLLLLGFPLGLLGLPLLLGHVVFHVFEGHHFGLPHLLPSMTAVLAALPEFLVAADV